MIGLKKLGVWIACKHENDEKPIYFWRLWAPKHCPGCGKELKGVINR